MGSNPSPRTKFEILAAEMSWLRLWYIACEEETEDTLTKGILDISENPYEKAFYGARNKFIRHAYEYYK